MTEQTPGSEPVAEETDVAKWLMLGLMGGIVLAVLAMEYYGYIQYPTEASNAEIDEFVLLSLSSEYEIKVSEKSSGKVAFCQNGYVLLRPTNGKSVAGILVDGKNRPVACHESMDYQPARQPKGEQ